MTHIYIILLRAVSLTHLIPNTYWGDYGWNFLFGKQVLHSLGLIRKEYPSC